MKSNVLIAAAALIWRMNKWAASRFWLLGCLLGGMPCCSRHLRLTLPYLITSVEIYEYMCTYTYKIARFWHCEFVGFLCLIFGARTDSLIILLRLFLVPENSWSCTHANSGRRMHTLDAFGAQKLGACGAQTQMVIKYNGFMPTLAHSPPLLITTAFATLTMTCTTPVNPVRKKHS